MEYDYIIVGGGSAGCVLANRLSARRANQVMLIEAGPDTPPDNVPEVISSSYTGFSYFDPRYHWTELRIFNESLSENERRPKPRKFEQARVMGGGSSINGQFALRGLPGDYDEWAEMGVAGWGWEDCLPYFKKLERDVDFDGPMHGREGRIPIRRIFPDQWAGYTKATLAALGARGYRYSHDLNTDFGDACFPIPFSNQYDRRVSTAVGYLDAATRLRPNLHILAEAVVEGLIVERGRVVGVRARRRGALAEHKAREVIVSAGGLHSPAILMRAGIGPAAHLAQHGIDVVMDLRGVGENLMEHPSLSAAAILKAGARLPPGVGRHIVFGLRYSSDYEGCPPGDMFILPGNKGGWHPLGRRIGTITLHCNKPYSRGVVRLRGAEPGDEPIVAFNLAADARDLWRLVDGLKRMRDVMESPEVRAVTEFWFPSGYSDQVRALAIPRFRNWLTTGIAAALIEMGGPARSYIRHRKLSPGFDVERHMADDEFLAEWVRGHVWGAWHPSGTCRMGAADDPDAVLDAACRVRGVGGLRVVDASVMPTIPRANTNIPTIMIAEKAADAILDG